MFIQNNIIWCHVIIYSRWLPEYSNWLNMPVAVISQVHAPLYTHIVSNLWKALLRLALHQSPPKSMMLFPANRVDSRQLLFRILSSKLSHTRSIAVLSSDLILRLQPMFRWCSCGTVVRECYYGRFTWDTYQPTWVTYQLFIATARPLLVTPIIHVYVEQLTAPY